MLSSVSGLKYRIKETTLNYFLPLKKIEMDFGSLKILPNNWFGLII